MVTRWPGSQEVGGSIPGCATKFVTFKLTVKAKTNNAMVGSVITASRKLQRQLHIINMDTVNTN